MSGYELLAFSAPNKHILHFHAHNYKAFRHVETLFVQGRNLERRRLAIGWRKVAGLQLVGGTRFLPWTNKVFTCPMALCNTIQ